MRTTALLTSAALWLLTASTARAQCAFDAPAKAKGVKADLVRTYSACPGVTFAAPNTSTMAGVPGCAPPTPRSEFEFGDKGACKFSLFVKLKEPCPNGEPAACMEMKIRAACKDIVQSDGSTPIDEGASGSGWALRVVVRGTIDDDTSGDMTVVDAPAELAFDTASNGKLKMNLTLLPCSGFDCGFFGPVHFLPACTSLEIPSAAIIDPAGSVFAKMGSSTR